MATMKAVVFKGLCEVSYEDVERPCNAQAGEAIVRVMACGLSGWDLNQYRGYEDGPVVGTVCGHDFAGVVEEAGAGVELAVGARVAGCFTTSCGECWFCTRSLSSRCERGQLFGWRAADGSGLHGAQAQFVRVPLANGTLVPLANSMSYEDGVLLGNALTTGYFCAKGAIALLAEADADKSQLSVAVLGCGPVGLCAVASAKALGVGTVYAVDSVTARVAAAVRLGARDLPPAAANGGRGVDAVLEAAGTSHSLDLAFKMVRIGGVVSAVGVHARAGGFPVTAADCYDKNVTFRSGRCPARSLVPEVVALLKPADITRHVVSHRVPLSAAPDIYEQLVAHANGMLKAIFNPWA
ncbi:hypothetical protein H4R19_003367 [Coemansia spiralis]|nr:hypothetical protein H4R19_003367 [Coemansia spiralis]